MKDVLYIALKLCWDISLISHPKALIEISYKWVAVNLLRQSGLPSLLSEQAVDEHGRKVSLQGYKRID